MLTLQTKIAAADYIDAELILPYELRERSRLRATLTNGEEAAVFTPRGTVLRNGDLLQADDGRVIRVTAAAEATYRIDCATPRDLLRCAFHLGNRHTQTQVGFGYLRIRTDAVLKDMLEGLGASLTEEMAAFEPEAGAYGGEHAHERHPLAPIPLRQKIHRPSDTER